MRVLPQKRFDSVAPFSLSSGKFKHQSSLLWCVLIFAVTFLAFSRMSAYQFSYWDDQGTIFENPRLNPPTWKTLGFYWTTGDELTTMGLYVPVTYTFWSGLARIARLQHPDAQGFTLNAGVFHTANILIHALTAVMVFRLLCRFFDDHIAALIGALFFALHPVQVETVGWVSGTKDLLCGLFSVGSLLMYVRSVQVSSGDVSPANARLARRWRYWLGAGLFVIAMLSKPTAVVVPLMAATIAVYILNRPTSITLKSLLPWFILMIPCMWWTKVIQPATWNSPLPLSARPAVAADAIAFYVYKLVWPLNLCVDYGHHPQAIVDNHLIYFTWVLPVALVALLCWKCNRNATAAALLWLFPLLPVLGFVGFEFQQISTTADHYLYLPMLGVAVFIAWTLTIIKSSSKTLFAVLILIAMAARTVLQEPAWQNTRTLFQHTLQVNPDSVIASDGLGFIAGREARRMTDPAQKQRARQLLDESIAWYQQSLTREPSSVPSLYNLALAYKAVGDLKQGREQLHRIVAIQPQLPPAMRVDPIDLARRLYDYPDIQGAIDWLDQVIQQNPRNTIALVLREKALQQLATSRPQ